MENSILMITRSSFSVGTILLYARGGRTNIDSISISDFQTISGKKMALDFVSQRTVIIRNSTFFNNRNPSCKKLYI